MRVKYGLLLINNNRETTGLPAHPSRNSFSGVGWISFGSYTGKAFQTKALLCVPKTGKMNLHKYTAALNFSETSQ